MNAYDVVKKILETEPETRNSDRALYVAVLKRRGVIKTVSFFGDQDAVLVKDLLSASLPNSETIRRARQKVQELCPSLQATSAYIRTQRYQKQATKSTFVFREEL